MKFEKAEVMNFEGAFRGLRNPLNSWAKSDSKFGLDTLYGAVSVARQIGKLYEKKYPEISVEDNATMLIMNGIFEKNVAHHICEYAFIGPADLDLAQRMIKAGSSDRKFLRQIMVCVDITAPLYWWKEFDTYKVSTVANSTSTMHKLSSTPITLDCFELGKGLSLNTEFDTQVQTIVRICEELRQKYLETKDVKYWKQLIQILPESWLQTRTWTANYETLRNMYIQRRNHKLSEWREFCDWVLTLPYAKELIIYESIK